VPGLVHDSATSDSHHCYRKWEWCQLTPERIIAICIQWIRQRRGL
jgi:hypothetical protein